MKIFLVLAAFIFGFNLYANEKAAVDLKLYGDFAIDVIERNGTIGIDIYNMRSPMVLRVANSAEKMDKTTEIRTLDVEFADDTSAKDKPLHFKTSIANTAGLKSVEVRLKKNSQILDPVQVWPEKKY